MEALLRIVPAMTAAAGPDLGCRPVAQPAAGPTSRVREACSPDHPATCTPRPGGHRGGGLTSTFGGSLPPARVPGFAPEGRRCTEWLLVPAPPSALLPINRLPSVPPPPALMAACSCFMSRFLPSSPHPWDTEGRGNGPPRGVGGHDAATVETLL
jgi:hypothetical protein